MTCFVIAVALSNASKRKKNNVIVGLTADGDGTPRFI